MFKHSVKVPLILQMEETEGGAACLNMILVFFRKRVRLDEVRLACGISRNGICPEDIIRAAESYGMDCREIACPANDLKIQITPPAILIGNLDQYFVLEGFRGDDALVIHPVKGRMSLSADELEKQYSGSCITFTPGSDFVADGERRGITAHLISALKTDGDTMLLVLLTGFLAAAGGIFSPVFSRIFTDDILSGNRTSWYPGVLFCFAAVIIFQLITFVIHRTLIIRATGKLAVTSNTEYMRHLLRLPMDFFSRRKTGDLANRQNANDDIAETMIGELAPLLMNLFMLVFYLLVMLQYSLLLTAIGAVTIVINLLVTRRIGTIRREISATQYRAQAELDSATVSGIDMIESIKATGSEAGYFERWSGFHAAVVRAQVRFNEVAQYLLMLPSFLQDLSNYIILFLGFLLIVQGNFTAGLLIAFMQLLSSLMTPVDDLLEAGENIQAMGASLERISDVMDYPEEIDPANDYTGIDYDNVQKLSGSVELRNVTFGYALYDEPLIENFSLELTPGKRVALVGGSGSGKSTIAKLTAGLLKPWSGEILFDGKKIEDIPRAVFRSSLTMVNQQISLFHDTMENNIKMWDSAIEDHDMILAARDASIHDFITSSRSGYQMMLNEGGKNLSGGQRQRVEISRVLAIDPTILIMDEATSALDARTEYEISEHVHARGITCIIVAHRLSTIRDCDEIIVLDHGKVIERGTHPELIAHDGLYRKLITNA